MSDSELRQIIRKRRVNSVLGWILIGFLLLVIIESIFSDRLWGLFAFGVAGLALLPPITHRNPLVMLPWEVLLLAVLPILGRSFATAVLTSQITLYLSISAVALIIAVELHAFTPVKMTPTFAVLFVVVGTMATAGIWAVSRWVIDIWIGTQFLHPVGLTEAEVETQLMWEFVYSTVAGIGGGLIFQYYFRRLNRGRELLPAGNSIEENLP